MSVSIERFACSVDDPCAVVAFAPVCGGRRFRRHFNKRDFPVLGDDYEDSIDRFVRTDNRVEMEQWVRAHNNVL